MLERRHFLQSAAAAAAFSTAPALPTSSASLAAAGPEAELEALYSRYLSSVAAAEAAADRSFDLCEAVRYPDPPAAASVMAGDAELALDFHEFMISPNSRQYAACDALRHFVARKGFYRTDELGYRRACRSEEILAALQSHEQARDAARAWVGADKAEWAACEAWAVANAHAKALATAQASTLRGVLMKARAIATAERDVEGLADWRADIVDNCRDPSTVLAVSAMLDLIRMTTAP